MPKRKSRAVTGKASSCPEFLSKLWQLVEDENTNEYIHWSDKGDSFIVSDQMTFATEVLPCVFKHNNLSSFIRQLNTYGFRKKSKIHHGSLFYNQNDLEFQHPHFLRGKLNQLQCIKRRNATSSLGATKRPAETVLSDDVENNHEAKDDNSVSEEQTVSSANETRPVGIAKSDVMETIKHEPEDNGRVSEVHTMSSANEASEQVVGQPTPALSTQLNGGPLADRDHCFAVPQATNATSATRQLTSSGRSRGRRRVRTYDERMIELAEARHRLTLQHMQLEHEMRMDVLAAQKHTEQQKLEAAIAALSKT
ncbi:uncharacterized protein [Diadema setosum]|uniref:uncharacterized protein n=1 Tax=Diadema setosum TaxID=31175 RepID=UPI003B3AD66D